MWEKMHVEGFDPGNIVLKQHILADEMILEWENRNTREGFFIKATTAGNE